MNIKNILNKHLKWLKNKSGAKKADLSRANLSRADLSGVNLSGVNLSGVNLSRADLSRADLFWADLSRADLSWVNLSGANLSRADLSRADLSGANLSGANLSRADLSGANLSRADLSGANLSRAKGTYRLKKLLLDKSIVLKYLEYKVYKNYFIAYKSFDEHNSSPKKWGEIKINKIIKERVNMDIYNICSRGINIGSLGWCKNNCNKQLWKVKVDFKADICIPIFTDGKIRVSECKIIKKY